MERSLWSRARSVGAWAFAFILAGVRTARGDVYINCGGSDLTDEASRVWVGDEEFLAPDQGETTAAGFDQPVDLSLLGALAPPGAALQSERTVDGNLRYAVPVERGWYLVTLYFSENHPERVGPALGGTGCAACARFFDIAVEGEAIERFSPADAALPPEGDGRGRTFAAVAREFLAGVADGTLDIRLRDLGAGDPPGDVTLSAVAVRFLSPLAPAPLFVRGDANADGQVDISDAICALGHLFGGAAPSCREAVEGCPDASDANDDGALDISDPIAALGHLFLGQEPPPEPFPSCGADRTADELAGCAYAPCASLAPEPPGSVRCGSAREIYRNLTGAPVAIAIEASDGCPSLPSRIACAGETRLVEDGASVTVEFQVPPEGSVVFECRGAGEGGCGYRVVSRSLREDVIALAADGSATVERRATISDALLLPLYQAYRRAYAASSSENQARESFGSEAEGHFLALLGSAPEALRGGFGTAGGALSLSQTGRIAAAAAYRAEEGFWRISVGPADEASLDFSLGRALNSMLFESIYLESILGEQILHIEDVTRFVLPEGAVLRNAGAIDGLSWEVDFGGGNRLVASVHVEGGDVVVAEESFVTERPPERLLAGSGVSVLEEFSRFRRFSIDYAAPPPEGAPAPGGAGGPEGEGAGGTCNVNLLAGYLSCLWSWNPSKHFEKTFSGSGYSVRAEVDLSLLFEARLGWDFNWSWSHGIYLDWFEAWIRANPSLAAELEAHANASLNKQWSTLITNSLYMDFWFNFGVPVWIRLRLEPYASAKVGLAAHFDAWYSASFASQNRLGVRWDDGWSWINERSNSASYKDLRIDTGATADLSVGSYYSAFQQPGVELKALVYNLAGPFVRGNPYVYGNLKVYPDHGEWKLYGGFTAWGGIQVAGWLRNLLGLGSYGSWDHKFYGWYNQIASGSWEIDIVPPANPTEVSSPSHVPGGWSRDKTVDVVWSGASDSGSGIAGYSILWDHGSGTVPDGAVETAGESATSPSLADGTWWFHVRAVDNAGNAAVGAVHLGPFRIDTTPPPRPVLLAPVNGGVLHDATPLFDWADVLDLSGVTYDLRVWYGGEIPEEGAAAGDGAGGEAVIVIAKDGLTESRYQVTSREGLADREYSWRVVAVDRAGNLSVSDVWTFAVDASP
ncbi:MAG: malectin domain-containing carbohydrate-binding protein [Planctomycetota bacterium]